MEEPNNNKRTEGRDGKAYYVTYGNDMYVPVHPTVEKKVLVESPKVKSPGLSSYYYAYPSRSRPLYYFDRPDPYYYYYV